MGMRGCARPVFSLHFYRLQFQSYSAATLKMGRAMPAFWVTIFLSAFLLFQVQPLIGKYVLPWFGGSPAVWTTCMLFFQIVLLAGYAYAHLLVTKLKPRTQMIVHLCLLVAAI